VTFAIGHGGVASGWVLENLAEFVAVTAGRPGRVARVDGGLLVSSPVPVANGYFNAAFPRGAVRPAEFLDRAASFFAESGSPFVLWVPEDDAGLLAAAAARATSVTPDRSPQMVIDVPLPMRTDLAVRVVDRAADRVLFCELCEEGYGIPGLAWILDHHDAFSAPGTTWAIAYDDDAPLGVGCSYSHGPTGGVYYVATPPGAARRGAASAVTAWLANGLLADGVGQVTLQASDVGLPVYERLGFEHQVRLHRFTFETG